MLLPVGIHFRVFQACQEPLYLIYPGRILLCILGDDDINQIDHKEPICSTIISQIELQGHIHDRYLMIGENGPSDSYKRHG